MNFGDELTAERKEGKDIGLISTIKASCRDCYKCVRSCPVKAIRITDGHAEVVEERCFADGKCVTICPQHAKKVESAIPVVKDFLASRLPVGASIAPSFVAAFGSESVGSFIAALKKLGFAYVEETAEGAEWVALAHQKLVKAGKGPVLTSCCPAIVNLIKVYYPQLLPYLAPVVSPMVARRIMKKRYGAETKIVLSARVSQKVRSKKNSQVSTRSSPLPNYRRCWMKNTLTWRSWRKKSLTETERISAHAFCSPGGLACSAMLSTDLLRPGGDDRWFGRNHRISEPFCRDQDSLKLVELLACRGGCVAARGWPGRRRSLLDGTGYLVMLHQRLRARGLRRAPFRQLRI